MIETERLTLRPLSRDDLVPWTVFMMDGDARAGLHTPEPATREEAEAALDRFVEVAEMYALIVRESGQTAGFVGFIPRTMEWGRSSSSGGCCCPRTAVAATAPRRRSRCGRSRANASSR